MSGGNVLPLLLKCVVFSQFYPNTGPLEGGTNITIEGENLGKMFEDIEKGVHILLETVNGSSLDVSCIPYQDLYVNGSR